MERAQETAAPVAEVLKLPVSTDVRLTEAMNVFEGKKVANDNKRLLPRPPQLLALPRSPPPVVRGRGLPRRGGAHEVGDRRRRAESRGHEALLVSHQLPIWIIRLATEKQAPVA